MARCSLCYKSATAGNNVSHSQIHTKRKFNPNLQKVNGLLLCTRCLNSIKKQQKIEQDLKQEKTKESQKDNQSE